MDCMAGVIAAGEMMVHIVEGALRDQFAEQEDAVAKTGGYKS